MVTLSPRWCRLGVTPDDLSHALPTLLPKKGTPAAEALEQAEASRSLDLPLEDLQRLRLRQMQNAQVFERQRSGVRFSTPHASPVCLIPHRTPLRQRSFLLAGLASSRLLS